MQLKVNAASRVTVDADKESRKAQQKQKEVIDFAIG